ncbi:MAG: efflux RND transporter periplasmic adaptor subunit [Candidatus Latescibacterota bacterium]|jgi:RND family efflux transporter MFP subunit|nr:efflux RND transporter periplasmic adaptor subunit [Ignavibacteriaceae bacterium]
MKKIIILIVVVAVSVVFITAHKTTKETYSMDERIPVRVMELTKENVNKTIIASGQFTTEDETFLSFKTGGIIKAIYVKEGDAVRKGQILATLELTEIDASVSQAKAGYEKALRDYNRVSSLYKDSVATLSRFQDAKTALEVATQQYNIAKYNLNYSSIRSIDNGFILKKFVNEGQMVSPGMPVLQTNGAGNGNWILKVSVSDNEWSAIKLNDHASIEVDALSNEILQAVVYKKSEGVDPSSGTFSIDLKLISKPSGKLASGLFGKTKITLSQSQSSWIIPYESILDGDRNSGYAFITNDNRTVQKVKVNITDIVEDKVMIDSGLENAQALITSGSAYLNETSIIKIVK